MPGFLLFHRVFLHSFCSSFYSPVFLNSSQSCLSVFSRVKVPVLFHSYSGLLYRFDSLWMPCSCQLGSYCLCVTVLPIMNEHKITRHSHLREHRSGCKVTHYPQFHLLCGGQCDVSAYQHCFFSFPFLVLKSFTHVYSEVGLAFKSCLLIK